MNVLSRKFSSVLAVTAITATMALASPVAAGVQTLGLIFGGRTPSITGDEAKVNFVFGPNLERNETMNMQRISGKWYLSSF